MKITLTDKNYIITCDRR